MANKKAAHILRPLLKARVWKKAFEETVSGNEAINEPESEIIVEHLRVALERHDYALIHGDVSEEIHKARMEEVKRKVDEIVVLVDKAFNRVVKHKVLSHYSSH
jgi:hypothetical protein